MTRFDGKEAHYLVELPDGKKFRVMSGSSLDDLMQDPKVTKYQPQQVKIAVEYD